jgi:hypothetical protein
MQSKFVNKSGWLTQYALACGYMETNEGWNDKRIACLEKDSACFHVKAYDENEKCNYWQGFDKYGDAKKAYIACLKERNAKRTINKG